MKDKKKRERTKDHNLQLLTVKISKYVKKIKKKGLNQLYSHMYVQYMYMLILTVNYCARGVH